MPRVFKRNSTGSSPSPTRKSPTTTLWGSPFSSTKRKSESSSRNARESLTFGQAGAMGTGELPPDNEFETPIRHIASDGDTPLSTRTPVAVGTLGSMKGRAKEESLASEVPFLSEHYNWRFLCTLRLKIAIGLIHCMHAHSLCSMLKCYSEWRCPPWKPFLSLRFVLCAFL